MSEIFTPKQISQILDWIDRDIGRNEIAQRTGRGRATITRLARKHGRTFRRTLGGPGPAPIYTKAEYKARVSERMRLKYATDPDYRERVKAAARASQPRKTRAASGWNNWRRNHPIYSLLIHLAGTFAPSATVDAECVTCGKRAGDGGEQCSLGEIHGGVVIEMHHPSYAPWNWRKVIPYCREHHPRKGRK